METFWMVIGSEPTFRHQSKKSACDEAERLARTYAGSTFVVLESIAFCTKQDVCWEKTRTADEFEGVPF